MAALPEAVRAREYLRERFPVPSGAEHLPDELLALYTPRSLIALQGILERIDQDLRAAPIEAALRLALLHALLPASQLNSYPGRVGALRISNGSVRQPGERQWRERNPWLLFEDGCRLVRGFIQRLEALPGGPLQARLGDDLVALVDGSANVVLRRGSPALTGNVTGPDRAAAGQARVRLVLSQPPVRWTTESLSAAYLTTSIVLGRDAAATLPLEPLVGSPPRSEWGWEAAALRRSLGAVVPLLTPESRAVLLLEPGGAEGLVAAVLGGVGCRLRPRGGPAGGGRRGLRGGPRVRCLRGPRRRACHVRGPTWPWPSREADAGSRRAGSASPTWSGP